MAEKELGVSLFDRVPQGLRLTAAGEQLIYNLRRWNHEFESIRVEIDNIQGLQKGKLTLALAEAMGNDMMAEFLREFHESHPNVVISIHVVGAGGVREMVLSGHADLGLTFMPTAYRVMRVEHSIALTPGLAVPAGHELASLDSISLAQCSELPLILPDDALRIRGSIDLALAALGLTLQTVATVNNFGLMKAMVTRGIGLAVISRAEILWEIRAGAIKFIPLSDPEIAKLSLSLVTPSHPSPAAMKLSRLIAGAMDEMAG